MSSQDEKKQAREKRKEARCAAGAGSKYDRRMTFDDIKDERALQMVDKLCVWIGDMLGCKVNRGTLLTEIRNGGKLCRLAEVITGMVEHYGKHHPDDEQVPNDLHAPCHYNEDCGPREQDAGCNVQKFLEWTNHFGVPESAVFAPDDLLKIKGKMKVVNTLLAIARKAKSCGVEADVDAPPKINNAFKGLEKKFGGDNFKNTASALTGGGELKKSSITLSKHSSWKRVQQKLDTILQLPNNVAYNIFREDQYQ